VKTVAVQAKCGIMYKNVHWGSKHAQIHIIGILYADICSVSGELAINGQ